MKSLVNSGIHKLKQMMAVDIIFIWDVTLYSLVVSRASIVRVSVLKMEAALTSETLIPTRICDITRCCIPEDSSVHNYRHEHFIS
jgi:hypothetical protein